jgi:serine/threonine-protein kinase
MGERGRPERIGKYRIDSVLGEGAMGVVYRAHDPGIDRAVAIKTVHTHLISAEERESWLDRFAREAKAAGRCMHPNLVTVFDYLIERETPYLVMEFVDAETLGDRLARGPLPSIAEIDALMAQILAGLGAIHGAGIVHRDVKPANIMLLPDGRVKIADFGVARVESLGATMGGMIGTPSYMSPEQFRGAPVDARSDIFACGVILFELLTGQKPYASRNLGELSQLVMQGAHRLPCELSPDLNEGIDAVVAQALAAEPDARFQTTAEFAAALTAELNSPDARALNETGERTVLVPPPAKQGAGAAVLSQTLADRLPESVFARIEKHLIEQIGPIGRVMLRKAASSTDDVERLIDMLAEQIDDPNDSRIFSESVRRYLAGGTLATSEIPDELIEELTRQLVPLVGPIAKVMVRRTAAKAQSPQELRDTLAGQIDDPRERARFLERTAV